MKGKIPVLRRCCYFFPLRYGLLAWGYLKAVADAFIITYLSFSMMQTVMDLKGYEVRDHMELHNSINEAMLVPAIALAIFVADFIATLLFIVGGHEKKVTLIKIFYVTSIAMWIFTLLMATFTIVFFINSIDSSASSDFWLRFLLAFLFYLVCLAVQTYIIFLVKNEINKFKNIDDSIFKNSAAEVECTMKCEEFGEREITNTGDVCKE